MGRNDPCPCGSGTKHKRCCLDVERTTLRIASAAEDRVLDLGDRVRATRPAEWRASYEDKVAPLNRFGVVPPGMAAWFDTWFVCDAPVMDGLCPVDAFADEEDAADTWLRASAISGWWVRGDEFPLAASHWRHEQRLTLHSVHESLGVLGSGALLVARGIDVGAGHVALVGRPVVVDAAAVDDVLGVLTTAPAEALLAALRWPEIRSHTAEGELVHDCYRCFELPDPQAAIETLRSAPGVVEQGDVLGYLEGDVVFAVTEPSAAQVVTPAPQRGVVWELLDEDRSDPRVVGEVTVSPADGELFLSAPTTARADRVLGALPSELRSKLGELVSEDLDGPAVQLRFSRELLEQLLPSGLPRGHAWPQPGIAA